jgi:hypothetical protein
MGNSEGKSEIEVSGGGIEGLGVSIGRDIWQERNCDKLTLHIQLRKKEKNSNQQEIYTTT